MFQAWFIRKYKEWSGDKIGIEASETEFARWLGITQQTVNYYLNGVFVPKRKDILKRLADKLGDEVYEILDQPTDKEKIMLILDQIPPQEYPRLIEELKRHYRVSPLNKTDPPDE